MVLYQSTTETPHILPLLPTVATYQMLIHQTDEPVVAMFCCKNTLQVSQKDVLI